MALNREQKRMLRKQGELGADGEPVRKARTAPKAPAPKQERTSIKQYVREVRAELRKVAWPTREETINYSVIVLVTLVLLTTLIFVLDFVFSEAVLRLFDAQ
jgi:preprotein translocase subunit SecE